MKKTPKWFYIVLVLIPLFILFLIEAGLRIFSYGKNLDQWVEITEEKLILNPDICARYFTSTQNYPNSNHDAFDKIKKENSIRIFVLGESSSAGFPFSPGGAFSRYIRDRFELQFPGNNIEVINLGISAVNTYTIKDLVPGIIEQHPDLVLIYAGHNEYYGALGVGSLESIGKSPFIVKTYLYLNRFKTFQLIKNILKSSSELFIKNNTLPSGATLMARMAEEKSIPFESEIYIAGLNQFQNNLENILAEFKENNIPAVIGTLVSNLKDLPPFISVKTEEYPEAKEVYERAKKEFEKNNYKTADSLFRFAKDLDALRFRAPESFNKIIKRLAEKYETSLVDIDAEFSRESESGITGNNLMVDHLHPTLKGYLLMGKIFSENIINNNLLKREHVKELSGKNIDSTVVSNFAFSKLDSAVSHFTILNLLNDWPFVEKKNRNLFDNIMLKNRIDSLAYKIIKQDFNWEIAHQEAYKWYLRNGDADNFYMELKALSSQYPFKTSYYLFAAQELIKLKEFDKAYFFLKKKYKIEPDEFTVKWLGNINLFNNNLDDAVYYLNKSIKFNPNDPQTFFNLALAYLRKNDFETARLNIESCLKIKPDYPNAKAMLLRLESLIKKPR